MTTDYEELIEQVAKAQQEIRAASHAGWGNLLDDVLDALRTLSDENERMDKALGVIEEMAGFWTGAAHGQYARDQRGK